VCADLLPRNRKLVVGLLLVGLACTKGGGASNRYGGGRSGTAGGSGGVGGSGRVGGGGGSGGVGGSGGSSLNLAFSRCIEDWPTAGGAHPRKPSLNVDAGKVLWRINVGGSQSGDLSDGGPVLSGDRIAFHASEWVYFVNKDGSVARQVSYNNAAERSSALVADLDGNVYYSAPGGLYSLDANGNLRWSLSSPVPPNVGEFASGIPPVLGPDGVVYFATVDKSVGAYRTSDGKQLWSRPGPANDNINRPRVVGGGGKALFVAYEGLYPDARTDALDTGDGTRLGSFVDPTNGNSFTWYWGVWLEGWTLGVAFANRYVFDICGNLSWSSNPSGMATVAPGEILVYGTIGQSGDVFLSHMDMLGNVIAGPAPAEGGPIAAGADGTVYNFRCEDAATSINRLLAYSYDLKELWRLDLGGNACKGMTGNVILDDDGVMYFTRRGYLLTEVIAIQTASPGLADSSWPSLRHDNRGTAWLVPGVGDSTATDGGDGSNAIDAPDPTSR
jgi:hypothetical protein